MTFVKLMNKWENNGDFFLKKNQAASFDIFLLHVEISTAACCEISQSQNSFMQDSQTMS